MSQQEEEKLRVWKVDYSTVHNGYSPRPILPKYVMTEMDVRIVESLGATVKEMTVILSENSDQDVLVEKIMDRIRYLHPHSYLPLLKDAIIFALNN